MIAVEVHDPSYGVWASSDAALGEFGCSFGRVRMQRIPDMSGDSLVPFGYENIKPSSTVITDC